ncbi:MAG: carboxypeptidase-like regulatory domain-containing protein [Bacteroidia bacterium]|nr:carboxypeptidase-like regulatory domain-containing protein [Bacteroidia bacterium]
MRRAVRYRSIASLPFIILSLFLVPQLVQAQETVVRGKVTDANSGDPIPFVNVVMQGTNIGTTTDFDGNFEIKTNTPTDTLVASYIGYKVRKKVVVKGTAQTINFQLEEDVTRLQEFVFEAGENPAYEILRRVVDNKNNNDKRKLTAYEYDTYTKIEIDVDNISDKFRQKKVMQKITQVLDSVDRIAGEDGKPILPLFISESVSKVYYRTNPKLTYENILKSKVNGVGVEDGTFVTQLVGSSFQEYNFYQNWLNIVTKEFVSPIADGWRIYYDYDLTDSLYIGDYFCYRLDFFPRSPQDLAFTGTIWITKEGYALKQVDASVGKAANLNFVEKIRIQQELEPTASGAWIPVKNRVLIDIGEINDRAAGVLAKFYTSNRNVVVNQPYDVPFYQHPIVMAEDARLNESDQAWDSLRHEPLTDTEKSVYKMIDTLQNIPVVRTYTDIVKVIVNGYYKTGKLLLGPYLSLVAINNIEGARVQGGFKTNIRFSNKWILGGSFGYGFKDEKIKYSAFVQNILSRERWTTLTVSARSDIGRIGIDEESLADNYLFLASQRFGFFRRGFYFDEYRVNFKRELFKGFSQRIAARYTTFKPTFHFGYYENPNDVNSDVLNNYETAEVILESRYARDELFLQDDNDRISLGATRWPVITLRYTHGIKGVFGSDFDYDKLKLSLSKRIKFGPLGVGYMNLAGEYVFDQIPYPLLLLHLGNQSVFYSGVTYNLMDYGEFVSDRYAALQYQHHFEGFLLNRIPLMKKLKWRLVGTANVIYGGMSDRNKSLIPDPVTYPDYLPVGALQPGRPYVELGYGVENIFKFFRVDFVHRLSYLTPETRRFGVYFSMQFDL